MEEREDLMELLIAVGDELYAEPRILSSASWLTK